MTPTHRAKFYNRWLNGAELPHAPIGQRSAVNVMGLYDVLYNDTRANLLVIRVVKCSLDLNSTPRLPLIFFRSSTTSDRGGIPSFIRLFSYSRSGSPGITNPGWPSTVLADLNLEIQLSMWCLNSSAGRKASTRMAQRNDRSPEPTGSAGGRKRRMGHPGAIVGAG